MVSQPFKAALRREPPTADHYKFLNVKYRSEQLGLLFARTAGLEELLSDEDAKDSVFVRYARGVLRGDYNDDKTLMGLVKATVDARERREAGKGMQNFEYTPALDEFAHQFAIISPQAYRHLQKSFQLPSLRHLQIKRSRMPQFPTSVCDRTFELVKDYVSSFNYFGPVALSCDDTKLHASFRTYWDSARKMTFLVGTTGDPVAVSDPDNLRELLKSAEGDKATKIRLWTLQIPLPNMPPLIAAAKAIPNNLDANELLHLSKTIIEGLIQRDIRVTSYSCDGTEVERSVQRLLIANGSSTVTYTIKHPVSGMADLRVVIALYNGRPIIMIQDSKHGLKTYRNNLYSGARLLVIGNHVAMYGYARDMAFEPGSPLYHRDVVKMDRQDDNAATRLFSSTALEFLANSHPDRLGQAIYIFVFGELIDAYQNRHISHLERIKMVLRARFFLDIWRLFLAKAGYSESRYFISREAADITNILIDGFISLVIAHRDYMENEVFPLLPWLHSSETCEHIFAECRKLIKDFTFLDFLYMIPRLHILIRAAVRFKHSGDANARAAGYAHTYFDSAGIDIAQLSVFPSDAEIEVAAKESWEEAESLFTLLGVSPSDLTSSQLVPARLPGINSWFGPGQDPAGNIESHQLQGTGQRIDDDDVYSEDEDEPWYYDSDGEESDQSDATTLQHLIDQEEHARIRTASVDDRMFALTCAAVAVSVDESMFARSFPDPLEEDTQEQIQEDFAQVSGALLAARLPTLNIPAEITRPFDHHSTTFFRNLDFSGLVKIRRVHETKQAATGVRTKMHQHDAVMEVSNGNTTPKSEASLRRKIVREMEAVLREQQDQGIGTGLERQARWKSSAPGGRTGEEIQALTGNSANAELAAGQKAKTVTDRREKYFTKFNVPQAKQLADGVVGVQNTRQPLHAPLQAGAFGIILHNARISICRVLAFYSQGGGKSGAHAWQSHSQQLGAVSYLAVQVYEPLHRQTFRAILQCTSALQVFTFSHLLPDHFLRLLPGAVQFSPDNRTLEVDQVGYEAFIELDRGTSKIIAATKALITARKRGSKKGKGVIQDEEE